MSDEQARYDREFLIIAACDMWPKVRAWLREVHRSLELAGVIDPTPAPTTPTETGDGHADQH